MGTSSTHFLLANRGYGQVQLSRSQPLQLGSIYERLLEHEMIRVEGEIVVRPNVFVRRSSGSYYTPDAVGLIIRQTVDPLVSDRMEAF